MSELLLAERGDPVVLTNDEYERWAPYLAVLQSHRIVRVKPAGRFLLLHPNQFAGSARCPAGLLQIRPKLPGVAEALRGSFGTDRRNVPLSAYDAAARSRDGSDIVSAFFSTLDDTLEGGLPFERRTEVTRGSFLTGMLDVGRTISEYESRGVNHMAVAASPRRQVLQPFANLLVTALAAIETHRTLSPVERSKFDLYASVLDDGQVVTSSAALATLPTLLQQLEARADAVVLCRRAADVISSAWSDDVVEYAARDLRFRFTDSDKLWERAVREALARALPEARARLHPLRGVMSPRYGNGGPDIDPDVVVYQHNQPLYVADAKDSVRLSPEAGDVYQIDNYVRALGVERGLLVYLSEGSSWTETFGDGSVRVSAIGVAVASSALIDAMTTLVRGALINESSRSTTRGTVS